MSSTGSFLLHRAWLRLLARAQSGNLGRRAAMLSDVVSLQLNMEEGKAEDSIDDVRYELESSADAIRMEDFGAGTRGSILSSESKPDERRVSEIYGRAAASPAWGRFLFRLVRALEPRSVLELGTNLGVSALHIAAALNLNAQGGKLRTIEGDPALSDIARRNLERLGYADHVNVLTGRFDEVLPGCLAEFGPFDLVFIDGHHEEAATLRYFQTIKPFLAAGACVAFDDIEPFRPVRRAWRRIVADEPNSGTLDLLGLGLWFAPTSAIAAESDAKAAVAVQ